MRSAISYVTIDRNNFTHVFSRYVLTRRNISARLFQDLSRMQRVTTAYTAAASYRPTSRPRWKRSPTPIIPSASPTSSSRNCRSIRKHFQGRPTPVYFAKQLSDEYGGRIYLKREDLNHTGAHKLNHCMGEALLAKYLGKKKLIAETGAGQHGVALATAAAYFGLECEIHMGEVDIKKEHPNVVRMKILGAKVVPVSAGPQDAQGGGRLGFRGLHGRPDNEHLLHRLRGRPPSLPDDGARVPAGRGHRGPGAVLRDDRRASRQCRGLRRRRQQRDGHLLGLHRGRERQALRRRAHGHAAPRPASTPRP